MPTLMRRPSRLREPRSRLEPRCCYSSSYSWLWLKVFLVHLYHFTGVRRLGAAPADPFIRALNWATTLAPGATSPVTCHRTWVYISGGAARRTFCPASITSIWGLADHVAPPSIENSTFASGRSAFAEPIA